MFSLKVLLLPLHYFFCQDEPITSTQIIHCGMTQDLRQQILDAHNEYRNKVANGSQSQQPGAIDMQAITYNMNLEKKASFWASTCPTGNNPEDYDEEGEGTGENIYFKWDASYNFSFDPSIGISAVSTWYAEVKNFNSSLINPFTQESKTARYTQLVWASLTSVGCGIVLCNDTRPLYKSFPYNTIIICNYSPQGNIDSETMYSASTGTPECKETPNTVYTALCGNPNFTAPSDPGHCGNYQSQNSEDDENVAAQTPLINSNDTQDSNVAQYSYTFYATQDPSQTNNSATQGTSRTSQPSNTKWVELKLKIWLKQNASQLKLIIAYLKKGLKKNEAKLKWSYDVLLVMKKGSSTQVVLNMTVKTQAKKSAKASAKYQVFYIYSGSQLILIYQRTFTASKSTTILPLAKAKSQAMKKK